VVASPTQYESLDAAAAVGMAPAWVAARDPERAAVISEFGRRSFAELDARANQLVRALRARGVKPGAPVALMCKNRPEFVETWAAATRGGYRLTPINWHLQAEETAYILNDCGAHALVADVLTADAVAGAAAGAPELRARLSVGGHIDGFEPLDDALREQDPRPIADPRAGTSMLYTSGTTGRPKGVRKPPGSQGPSVPASALGAPLVGGESLALCAGPLYHAAPYAYNLVQPLTAGVGVVLMDRWDAEDTLRLIERHRVTHTHLVATMFHRLLALPQATRAAYDVSSLQLVLHGAAPTPEHVKRAMIDWWGPIIHEYYAGTEGGSTLITAKEWLQRPGSVGRPTPGRAVEILDDAGAPLPAGEVGRVFFHAPEAGGFVYHGDAGRTRAVYEGHRFTLGDLGYLDGDGYLFLTGRTADRIISGGVNIDPGEVDEVLHRHPAVDDVVTVGVPNEEFGEEVKAVIALHGGYAPSPALERELIDFTREHLAHLKCPRSVDFVDALPRSAAGKISRKQVRRRYWEGTGREL
jgi:long-chain acyl-CoA synthetase